MAQGNFILAPGEFFVRCPYNFSHQITNARLVTHLTNCRKQYKKECERAGKPKEIRICNFNDNHRVYAPEIQHHEETCPDRYRVVQTIRYHQSDEFRLKLQEDERRRHVGPEEDKKFKTSEGERDHKRRQKEKVSNTAEDCGQDQKSKVWGQDTEDWEIDANGYEAAYNPEEKLQQGGILYQPRGLSKSERKKFRAEQKVKASEREFSKESVDVDQFSKLDLESKHSVKEEEWDVKPSTSKANNVLRPPKIESIVKDRKTDYRPENSEDDFFGEDPFS